MMSLFALLALFVGVGSYLGYFVYRRRRLVTKDWEDVLAAFKPVDMVNLRLVAASCLRSSRGDVAPTSKELLELAGGLQGIRNLRANATMMINLAIFAERWNGNWDGGPAISELIRAEGVHLNRAIFRVQLAVFFPFGAGDLQNHLTQASTSYDAMRARLIGLYESTYIKLVPSLELAI